MAAMTEMMAQASRRRGRHDQVSSGRAGGGYGARGGSKGENTDEITVWSGEEYDGMATDEGATTAEGVGWDGEPWTATAGTTRRSGTNGCSDDAMAGGGKSGKASSTAANKAGASGRHGARPVKRGRVAGWRENSASKSLGVRGDDRGREVSGVAHDTSVVGYEEGGRKAFEVEKNPQGSRQGVGGGVESPQGTNTPGVAEVPRGKNTPE